ncbi:MAG TPA: hypothetical protein VEO02_09270 [Thermoanaerobaculia bacterium]|nr:hypothetical protein [Thermoanaerobaculia bacterium]
MTEQILRRFLLRARRVGDLRACPELEGVDRIDGSRSFASLRMTEKKRRDDRKESEGRIERGEGMTAAGSRARMAADDYFRIWKRLL